MIRTSIYSGEPEDFLKNDILPHCDGNALAKALVVGNMVQRLLQRHTQNLKADDRDSYLNKRVVLTGTLLGQRFRQLYQQVVKDMKSKMSYELNNGVWKKSGRIEMMMTEAALSRIIRMSVLDTKLHRSIANGCFNPEEPMVGLLRGYASISAIQPLQCS